MFKYIEFFLSSTFLHILLYIAVICVAVFFILIFLGMESVLHQYKNLKREISRDPVNVLGEIINIKEQGYHLRDTIGADVYFSYRLEDDTVLEGKDHLSIKYHHFDRYQPGKKIPLQYLKSDPKKVVVDINGVTI